MPDAIIAIFLQSTKHLKASSAAAARTKDNKDDKNCPNFPHSTAAARTEDNKDDKKLPKLPPFHCCCKNRRQQRWQKTAQTSPFPAHNCQLWSFWHIIVDQVTIYNCHGKSPWCNCINDKIDPIPGLHKPVPLIIVTGNWRLDGLWQRNELQFKKWATGTCRKEISQEDLKNHHVHEPSLTHYWSRCSMPSITIISLWMVSQHFHKLPVLQQ